MAVAIILDFPGGTKEDYDAVVGRMQLGGRLPPGGLFHAAGAHPSGWRVIDAWDDLATFEAFRDAKIGPLSAEQGMQPPRVQVVEAHERKSASGAEPVLAQVVRLPGMDAARFAAMDARILPGGEPLSGLAFHLNGPVDGGWCVVDAWSSRDAYERFLDERIRPNIDEMSMTGPPEIEVTAVEASLRPQEAATTA